MTSKTLEITHGDDRDSGATVTFTADKLAKNADTYVFKNKAGEVVATLKIAKGARAREI